MNRPLLSQFLATALVFAPGQLNASIAPGELTSLMVSLVPVQEKAPTAATTRDPYPSTTPQTEKPIAFYPDASMSDGRMFLSASGRTCLSEALAKAEAENLLHGGKISVNPDNDPQAPVDEDEGLYMIAIDGNYHGNALEAQITLADGKYSVDYNTGNYPGTDKIQIDARLKRLIEGCVFLKKQPLFVPR